MQFMTATDEDECTDDKIQRWHTGDDRQRAVSVGHQPYVILSHKQLQRYITEPREEWRIILTEKCWNISQKDITDNLDGRRDEWSASIERLTGSMIMYGWISSHMALFEHKNKTIKYAIKPNKLSRQKNILNFELNCRHCLRVMPRVL